MPFFKTLNTNRGCVTISNPCSTATVAHGLGLTPDVEDINVVLTSNPCPIGAGVFWITCVGACNFVVNLDAAPAACTSVSLAWKIIACD